MSDDADLLRRYAEDRSEADFTAWVQRHFDLVYSAALRQLRGDPHRAREAAQMVFVDAARKARDLARHPALVGWLHTSTHFAVQKLIRAEARRLIREDAAHSLHGDSAAPAAGFWGDLRPYLDAELLALGSVDRTALLLRFFEQKPLAAVGSELGLSENGARMRVDRALAKLRQRLSRRGVTSSAAALSAALAGNAVAAAPAGLSAAVAVSSLAEIASLAAGAAGGAAVLGTLMASKFMIGALTACGLAALGTGVYYGVQAQGAERALTALRLECAQLDAGLKAVPAARTGIAARENPAKREGGAGLQNDSRAGQLREVRDELSKASDAVLKEYGENPQVRLALARSRLAEFRLRYAPLSAAMGLTDAQLTQLARAHLKMESDLFDLDLAARQLGQDTSTSAGYQALAQPITEAYAGVLLGLVGPQGVQRFQDYDRGYPAQEIVRQVAAGSFYSAAPLTSTQAELLGHFLTNASPAFQQGKTVDLDEIDWASVMNQAAQQLPAPQVAALRAWRAEKMGRQLADDAARETAP